MSYYKKIAAQAISLMCAVTMIGSNLSVAPCMAEETTGNEAVTDNTENADDTESVSILTEGDESNFHWAVTDQYELVISPNAKWSSIPDYYEVYENPDPLQLNHYLEAFKPRPWDEFSEDITSVKICDGITKIGGYAFNHMIRLENVSIADSVSHIGKNAFAGTAIKSIKLPQKVTFISGNLFEKCSLLETVDLSDDTTIIDKYAFSGCTSLKEINLPENLRYIRDYAFSDCVSITELNLPNTLETIGEYAFRGCTGLTNIVIPDSVTSIRWGSFHDCSALMGLTILNPTANIMYSRGFGSEGNPDFTIYGIPRSTAWKFANYYGINFSVLSGYEDEVYTFADGLTWSFQNICTLVIEGNGEIPDYTMEDDDCPPWYEYRDSIREVVIGEGITKIGNYAFNNLEAREVSIPSTLKVIGESAFEGSSYQEVTISKSVTSIGSKAFSSCYDLEIIDIPESVTSIGSEAFSHCRNLETIDIPESVTSIGSKAFSSCYDLETINLPESVTSIGHGAFSYCEKLKSIKIPNGVTEISASLFENCRSLETVELPDNIEIIGSAAFDDCTSLKNINLEDNVREIGTHAFSDCTSLTNIKFGSSLKEICDDAFINSGLTGNIIIPANVDKIHGDAFYNCKGIESYTILNPDILLDGWGGSNMGTICIEEKTNSGGIIRIITNTPTVFYGYRDSTTEAYANKYNAFTFVALDDMCEKGDINLDGRINVSDLVLLQQYLVKKASLTIEQWNCADITEDGSVNVFDETLLRRKLIEFNKK